MEQKGGIIQEIKDSLKNLYFEKSNARTSWSLLSMFIAVTIIYFLGIYNSAELKGNLFNIEITFGFALLAGVIASEIALRRVPASTCMFVGNFFIMAIALVIKSGLNYYVFYVLFIIQSMLIGSMVNFCCVMGCTKVDQRYISISFEINLAIG